MVINRITIDFKYKIVNISITIVLYIHALFNFKL